jgi:AcrR family transcriptional regulator
MESSILLPVTRPSYAQRRKLALREEILDAAFDVFAERGYHNAGVADIAERVGIGHSTFYRHFDSKRDIFDQVIETVIERSMTALAAENAPDAARTLHEYRAQVQRIAAALDEITSDLRVVRIMLSQVAGVDVELEQKVFGMFDLAVTLTAGYFENGKTRGFLRTDLDTAATARAVVGMILGSAMLGLIPDIGPSDRTSALQAAIRLMFDGIAAP